MATARSLFSVSAAAAADYSAKQYYAVKFSAVGPPPTATVCSTAGEFAHGILQGDPDTAGDGCSVAVAGTSKCVAGAAITFDDVLTVDSSGRAVTRTNASQSVLGRAMRAATAAGDVIEVLLMQQAVTSTIGKGTIQIPMSVWQEQDGTALADFSAGTSNTPGYSAGDESFGIRWNNASAPDPISASITLPVDFDTASDITMNILAAKVGATIGDATTWTVEAFGNVNAALYDADADFGGTSSAMTGDATSKTCQLETLTLATADLPAAGSQVVLTIQPTDGTLGTDDVILLGVSLDYVRK